MDFLCEKKLSEGSRNKAPSREKITAGKCLRELTGVTLESAGISIMYHEAFPCDEDHEGGEVQLGLVDIEIVPPERPRHACNHTSSAFTIQVAAPHLLPARHRWACDPCGA